MHRECLVQANIIVTSCSRLAHVKHCACDELLRVRTKSLLHPLLIAVNDCIPQTCCQVAVSWVVGLLLQTLHEIVESVWILGNIVNYYLSPFAIYLNWLINAFCIVGVDQPMALEVRKQDEWVGVLYQLRHQFVEHFPFNCFGFVPLTVDSCIGVWM